MVGSFSLPPSYLSRSAQVGAGRLEIYRLGLGRSGILGIQVIGGAGGEGRVAAPS